MGKVTSFALAGLFLWFNSDDHLPAHFHAERTDEWELRVFFLRDPVEMFEVRWTSGRGPAAADLRDLAKLVVANRVDLLAEWQFESERENTRQEETIMSAAVDVLVSERDMRAVKLALGPLSSARFATHAPPGATSWIVVSSIAALATAQGCREVEALVRPTRRAAPVALMLLAFRGVAVGLGVAAGIARLAHEAGSEPYVAPDRESARRIIAARQRNAGGELIASATLEGDRLIVWSCEPKRYEVAIAEIPSLSRLTSEERGAFDISPSGSRIHWPHGDVDVNLDAIRERVDPELRKAHDAQARKDAARYAGSIRRLREQRGLKQTDIVGLSERQVRRLEEGDTVPHAASLRKLAAAHGMPVNDYLVELAKKTPAAVPSARRRVRA